MSAGPAPISPGQLTRRRCPQAEVREPSALLTPSQSSKRAIFTCGQSMPSRKEDRPLLAADSEPSPPESIPRLAAVQALFGTAERPHAALGALQRPECPQLATLDAPRTSRAPCARSQTIRPVASRCSPRAVTPNVGASPLRDPCRREAVERAVWGSSRCRGAEYERPFRPC